jgi:hypothetical protein
MNNNQKENQDHRAKSQKLKSESSRENKIKLENVLAFVNEWLKEGKRIDPSFVFAIVKMFADKMSYTNAVSLSTLSLKDEEEQQDSYQSRLKFLPTTTDEFYSSGIYKNCKRIKDEAIDINFNKDPFLICPWKTDKLYRALKDKKGSKNNPVPKNDDAYLSITYLPFGLTFLNSHTHAATSAKIYNGSNDFYIVAGGDDEEHLIFDVSSLYSDISFDGTNFIKKEIDKIEIVWEDPVFELGVIYEIGRLIHENNISFLDYKFRLKNIN